MCDWYVRIGDGLGLWAGGVGTAAEATGSPREADFTVWEPAGSGFHCVGARGKPISPCGAPREDDSTMFRYIDGAKKIATNLEIIFVTRDKIQRYERCGDVIS